MKNYRVKSEYLDSWYGGLSTDEIGDAIVDEDEVDAYETALSTETEDEDK